MSLSFLNPGFLGALALGAIPILIHLIRKRKVVVVQWAAWEFLQLAVKKNRKRLRIEQLLLLILRILIVLLLVLVFARPVLRSLGLSFVPTDSRVHLLVILDGSFSMAHQRDGLSDFDRAKRFADNLLSRVAKQGDSVSVMLASARPQMLLKSASYDLSKGREAVRTARITDFATDYAAVAELAAESLADISVPTKEVYFLTDSQRGALATEPERLGSAWRQLSQSARVTWVDVGEGERANLAIDTPQFSRELITPQSPVRIDAVVHNYGPADKQGLQVYLTVDGRPSGAVRLDVPANGKATAQFVHLFEKPGAHVGKIALSQPDSLSADGETWFAAKVRDNLKVLIINLSPNPDPQKDESFYLETALSPLSATAGGSSTVQTTIHTSPSFETVSLRQYDAVALVSLPTVTPEAQRALNDYVRNGGGLLTFLPSSTDAEGMNRLLMGSDPLLPANLGSLRRLPEEGALNLNPATINHPALDRLKDTSEVNLGSGQFTHAWELKLPDGDSASRVICKFADGQPAIAERAVGQGKVIMVASSAGATGNNLPFKPAYVPFVHQLIAYLASGQAAQTNIRVGDPFIVRFDVKESGKPADIRLPGGEVRPEKTTLTGDGVVLKFGETQAAGVYGVQLGADKQAAAFAATRDPVESDLAHANEGELRAMLGRPKIEVASIGEDAVSISQRNRRGAEMWRTLGIAVLALLFLESLLAQRFGRRG